ncbi:Nucleoside 2-deoxyribosyltransferase like [uncultured Caudovirales phage]|uniref:Nucleoside 2-deoxyribosyltransferase like n=1 Tax=uncultured Caudovirales phage TaxID=2100421 RepID=A0A6J5PNK2_9CAUD|nr:Nucleoside 2-deoxyribosyltransferase like [uncultured Caudovirales phage]CAB4170775.1 Nucleoside 2-deoxyribosyltransferase like [uncultured Caudovirales phage]CAB4198450.1 Nucleoside 2-deoxyribosyltransferase like [uncultured Caudovirales phage]
MKVIKPPHSITDRVMKHPTIFLAGSIEMGKAEDWQQKMEWLFRDGDATIFNPRREEWDSSWSQDIENPQFYQQVNWELNALEKSDLIFMYFAPGTQSPISLLELGLFAHTGKMIVCCPEGFWRKGNVDIVCDRYDIPVFSNVVAAQGELYNRWLELSK